MNRGDYLLLRRDGALWGVPNAGVTAVRRGAGGVLVETCSGSLVADEAVAVTEGLEVHRSGALLRRLAGAGTEGLAVYRGLCVAIVDPAHPPEALRPTGGGAPRAATAPSRAPATESNLPEGTEGEAGDGTTGV